MIKWDVMQRLEWMSENDRLFFLEGRTRDHVVLLSEEGVSWYFLRYDDCQHRYPFINDIKKSLEREHHQKLGVYVIILVIFGSWIMFVGWHDLPPTTRPLEFLPSFVQLLLIALISSAFLGVMLYNALGKSFFFASKSPAHVHRCLREVFLQQRGCHPDFYHVITISRKVRQFSNENQMTIPEHWLLGCRVRTRYLRRKSRFTVGPRPKTPMGQGFRFVLQGYFEVKIAEDGEIEDNQALRTTLQQICVYLGRDFASTHEFHGMIIRGARIDEQVVTEIEPFILERLLANKPVLDPSMQMSLVEIKKSSDIAFRNLKKLDRSIGNA